MAPAYEKLSHLVWPGMAAAQIKPLTVLPSSLEEGPQDLLMDSRCVFGRGWLRLRGCGKQRNLEEPPYF